ncbi:MAG: energy-coupling factor transporter ATPase [Bacilli bacterium]|nr:energy-coupling factor transporter ATPase [Bacilli bacterium]
MPITSKKLSYIYNPKTPVAKLALDEVSFHLEEGGFIALVGRTGCGKSTLVQHLNALLFPTGGEIEIDDFLNAAEKKRRSKKLFEVRAKVGVVFQFSEQQLFEETVEKDVCFGPKNFGLSEEKALEKAHESLAKVGLGEEFYKRSPFDLSGGEKRRVAIAGVLACSPKYLVLDEPTAGLDPYGAKQMMELFKSINDSGVTIIFVTHDMNLVLGYASEVLIFHDGKLMKQGKPEDLFQEDLSSYSLESPLSYSFARKLNDKGMGLELSKCKDEVSLAKEIAKRKGK